MSHPLEQSPLGFDPTEFLLKEVGEITNHQTDLPRIAKDPRIVAAIETKLEQLPTAHDLYRRDARDLRCCVQSLSTSSSRRRPTGI